MFKYANKLVALQKEEPKHPFEGMRHLVPEPLPLPAVEFSEDEEEYPEDGYWFPLP